MRIQNSLADIHLKFYLKHTCGQSMMGVAVNTASSKGQQLALLRRANVDEGCMDAISLGLRLSLGIKSCSQYLLTLLLGSKYVRPWLLGFHVI